MLSGKTALIAISVFIVVLPRCLCMLKAADVLRLQRLLMSYQPLNNANAMTAMASAATIRAMFDRVMSFLASCALTPGLGQRVDRVKSNVKL
jgi:hypothetical protein